MSKSANFTILYAGSKYPFGSCYVSCFLTDRTALISIKKIFLEKKYAHKNCNFGPFGFLKKLRVTHFPTLTILLSMPINILPCNVLKNRNDHHTHCGKTTSNVKIFKKNLSREYKKNILKHPHSNFEVDQDFFSDFMSYNII